jgi:ATP-dependent exoDNAse (exonuclease V) alpha subunit
MLRDVKQLHKAEFVPLPENFVSAALNKKRRVVRSQPTTPIGKLCDVIRADKRTYTLDEEQRMCVRYATQSPARMKTIYGAAGTAKTTVAEAIADAYQKAGFKTLAVSNAGAAAKNFAEKTGVESDTLRMTLKRLYPTAVDIVTHTATQLWHEARGNRTYQLDRLKLDAHTLVFVDEAATAATRDLALLVKACVRSGSTMILLGDAKQLPAVEQGGAFGSIIARFGGFELKDIKRQESAEERERVRQLYRGETEAVLKSYAAEGKLHVAQTHSEAQKELIRQWVKNGGIDAPKDHAIFAGTHVEIRNLNDMAQRARMEAGKLGKWQSITLNDETFYRGDRVAFTKKSRRLQLENGDSGVIVGIRNNPLSAAVKVRLDGERKTREIPIRTLARTHYEGITRAYASTVHAMQGRTTEHAYCSLLGSMTDQELTYVALSRHRKSVYIFTDENHAGVALTNVAREASGEHNKITAKPGLDQNYSPLLAQAKKSHAKTLAMDQKNTSSLTLKLEPEG